MKRITLSSQALFDLLIHPAFLPFSGDVRSYNGTLNEFSLVNDVPLGKGKMIMDIFSKRNILQRKDASCKTNWSQIAHGSTRRMTVDELYGAVEDCQEAFYQGCLKDFREDSAIFRDIVLTFFKDILLMDIASNSYFGDLTRPSNDVWSWNMFDGIFAQYKKYIQLGGELKPVVTSAIPSGEISPSDAFKVFEEAYKKITPVMKLQLKSDLGFYVNSELAESLEAYYVAIGTLNGNIGILMDGLPSLRFKGIPVYVEPVWSPILTAMNANVEAHALILTIRKNFIFGTNKKYGGGANLDQALRVWWSEDDEVWRYKMHLAAGTEITAPQHSVLSLTNIA